MENDTRSIWLIVVIQGRFSRKKIMSILGPLHISSRSIRLSTINLDRMFIQVLCSVPTRRQPIHGHIVSIYFTIDVSKCEPKVNSYSIDSCLIRNIAEKRISIEVMRTLSTDVTFRSFESMCKLETLTVHIDEHDC
jgi:hypothetical protein